MRAAAQYLHGKNTFFSFLFQSIFLSKVTEIRYLVSVQYKYFNLLSQVKIRRTRLNFRYLHYKRTDFPRTMFLLSLFRADLVNNNPLIGPLLVLCLPSGENGLVMRLGANHPDPTLPLFFWLLSTGAIQLFTRADAKFHEDGFLFKNFQKIVKICKKKCKNFKSL